MTLDEAAAAVEATFESDALLRVDRKLAREDASSYLLLVLDTSRGRHQGAVDNGPRLVDKRSGGVTRLTVPDAIACAERMTLVRVLTVRR